MKNNLFGGWAYYWFKAGYSTVQNACGKCQSNLPSLREPTEDSKKRKALSLRVIEKGPSVFDLGI